jgi:D-alanine transfer protein
MFSPEAALDRTYPANFSQLHAAELVFNDWLSWSLKKDLAKRMLQYPETLEKDPILQFALNKLVSGGRRDRLQYFAVLPLGKLDVLDLRLQDHWEAVKYIWGHLELEQTGLREPASIDWETLAKQAEDAYKPQANNNPFGFDNQVWDKKIGKAPAQGKPGSGDGPFVMKLAASPEWDDLELLLRTLKEMGANTLLLNRPYSGLFYDYEGISIKARTVYYETVQKKAAAYGFQVIDFRSHDSELYFNRDATSHTSPKGWVFVNQALDTFYHSKH